MSECAIEEIGTEKISAGETGATEIGVRVQADAPEQLFACAAQAMFALLRLSPSPHGPALHHHLTIHSADGEGLLVDWLNELLYLYQTSGALFTTCTVLRWRATYLEANVTGYPTDQQPVVKLKAATYHQLTLQANSAGWLAEVYFDYEIYK